jgi:hypothetical protein
MARCVCPPGSARSGYCLGIHRWRRSALDEQVILEDFLPE